MTGSTRRILIVDDDTDLGDLFYRYLTGSGYEAEVCRDGLDALKKIAETHYDLILLDVMMPKIDGLTFLTQAGDKLKDTAVIMLTNLTRDLVVEKAMQNGAIGYINKTDITPDILVSKVKGFLGQAE